MSPFETIKSSLFNRLYSYRNGRSDKDLMDLITHFMRFYARAIYKFETNDRYDFSATDIEIMYYRILSEIMPR